MPASTQFARDLGVGPHRVVDVAVVLHVVGVRAAVAPDIAGDPPRRADVVVAADPADVLLPRPDADESRAVAVGQDLLGLREVHDDLGVLRDRQAEGRHRGGLADDRLDRVAGPDPPVVAAVEQPDVVDPGVAQDHQRPRRGDLPGPPPRPLLVRVADRVAAVDDDRRVVGDAEGAHGGVDLGRGPALPDVLGILEPVRVQVQGARKMAFLVLLRDAEVDMEQEEPAGRGRFRATAGEELAEPLDVDEPVVLRQALDGTLGCRNPAREAAGQDPGRLDPVRPEHVGDNGRFGVVLAVDHDVAPGRDPLAAQEPDDLGPVDADEPGRRQGDRARDVAAARLVTDPPAVVGAEGPDVDDRQLGPGQDGLEPGGVDGGRGGSVNRRRVSHRMVLVVCCRENKRPPHLQGSWWRARRAGRLLEAHA